MKQELFKQTTNFSRGLSLAASPLIGADECQAAENFVFEDRSATVREGVAVFGSLPARVDVLRKLYKRDGTAFNIAIAGAKLYKSDTSGTFDLVTGSTYEGEIHAAVFDDVLYFSNYSSPVKFFDGTSVDDAGLSSPIFRKQINDCESLSEWSNTDLNGAFEENNDWSNIDKGEKAILFSASNKIGQAVFSAEGSKTSNYIVFSETGGSPSNNNLNWNLMRDISGIMTIVTNKYIIKSVTNGSSWVTMSTASTGQSLLGRSTVDSSGNVYGLRFRTSGEQRWAVYNYGTSAEPLSIKAVGLSSETPLYGCLTTDVSNIIHAIYQYNTTSGHYEMWYENNVSSNVSSWLGTKTYIASSYFAANMPDILIDGNNDKHITWVRHTPNGILYTRTSGGIWTSSDITAISGYIVPLFYGNYPRMAVDGSNNIIIGANIKSVSGGDRLEVFANKFYAMSGTWGAQEQITISSKQNQLYLNTGVNSDNKPFLLWLCREDNAGHKGIAYAENNLSSWSNIQIYGTSTPVYLESLYHWWPRSLGATTSGNRPGVVAKGWAMQWEGIGFRTSPDLLYYGDTAPSTENLNLTEFAPGIASSSQDSIEFFTTHRKQANISSFSLVFKDSDSQTAKIHVGTGTSGLSSWMICSNDNFGITHIVPKSTLILSSSNFQWGSCHLEVHLTPSSSTVNLAQVTVDNIRMIKSPPVPSTYISSKADVSGLYLVANDPQFAQYKLQMSKLGEDIRKNRDNFTFQLARGDIFGSLVGMGRGRKKKRRQNQKQDEINVAIQREIQSRTEHENNRWETTPFPDGTYYYKQTFLKKGPNNRWIESNPSYQSSGIVIPMDLSSHYAVQLIDLVTAPADWNVTQRRFYRRMKDAYDEQLCMIVNDNNTSSIIDWTPQQVLGNVIEDYHWPPPNCKYLYMAKNMTMYYLNILEEGTRYTSRIRKSVPYEPYYAPLENTQDLAPNDGTEGTGIFEFMGVVYALKERSLWAENAQTEDFNNVHASIGCIAPKSIAIGDNEIFWLSEQGVVKFNGRITLINNSLDGISTNRILTILNRLPSDYIKNSVGHYYKGKYLLAVTDKDSTTNNLVLCYDTNNDVWSTFHDLPGGVNCWDSWQGYKDGYRLFYGNYSGQVCEMFTGNYDISTPIRSTLWTRSFGAPTPQIAMRSAYLAMENLDGEQKAIQIQPYFDLATTSSYIDSQVLSSDTALLKYSMPQYGGTSFASLRINSSGRYKCYSADFYGKEEELR